MSAAKLEILSGSLEGRTYAVDDDEFVIGRGRGCQLVIPKRYVSRQHARISRDGSDYIVDGLSEKNPVRVNSRAIREHLLSDGDVFEFCGIKIRFREAKGGSRRRGGQPRQSKPASRSKPAEDSWAPAPAGDPEDSWAEAPASGGKESWRDDAAEDSWQDAPASEPADDSWAAAPAAKAGGGWKDEDPADDSWAAAPSPQDDDDSWGAPAQKNWDDDESEDSFEDKLSKRASKRGSRSERVVFDAGDDDSEGTGELPLDALRNMSSRGSGSGVHGESSNERTAELDAGPKDLDDPDYDPFAEVEATKKRGREADPARERAVRALSIVGLLGIALAGGIYHNSTKVEPWKPPIPANDDTRIHVAVGQTVRHEEPWASNDPPETSLTTMINGKPWHFHKDAIAEVDWSVRQIKGRAVWFVTGLESGSTEFAVRYPRSRRIKMFEVVVEGDDPHLLERDKRRAEFKKKPQRTLDKLMRQAMASGESFRSLRDAEAKESYYRESMLKFAEAADAAQALRSKGFALQEKALRKVEDAEQKAREDYEAFVEREFARYRDLVARHEPLTDCAEQLKRVLRGISHQCDPRYRRLSLLLSESYKERMDSTGAELCEHYGR